MMQAFLEKFKKRVVSAETLAVRWIETRTPLEMTLFSQLSEITHNIIAEAFSTDVITPGVTTTEDVVWWMREKVTALGLKTWFHPTVDVQRTGASDLYAFDGNPNLTSSSRATWSLRFWDYLFDLNTDCQELAYVLKARETKLRIFKRGLTPRQCRSRCLDDHFKTGRTGNATLKMAIEAVKRQAYAHKSIPILWFVRPLSRDDLWDVGRPRRHPRIWGTPSL